MAKKEGYFEYAENDFRFLKESVAHGFVYNGMCSLAQNICEKYMKYIAEKKADALNETHVMKTHNLSILKKFLKRHFPEIPADWDVVEKANGFYFSSRYPGEDSFFVDEEDISICWRAAQEAKQAAHYYKTHILGQKEGQQEDYMWVNNIFQGPRR